jgi:branched-chain amino acid transport system substrate-binding protein
MIKIIFSIIISVSFLYPQNINVDNNKDFEKALSYYNSKNYETALNLFQKIFNKTENNTKVTASAFFISKILVEQKKYSDAEKSMNDFLLKFPQSKYTDEIKNLLIKNYLDKNDYNGAFNNSLKFIESSKSIVFKKETKSIADKIAVNYLNNSDVESFLDNYSNSSLKSFLLLISGKIYLREGEQIDAHKKFTEITTKHSTSDEYVEALNLQKLNNNIISENKFPIVGIIFSLTDQNDREIEVAKEVLEGIKYAFHEYNTSHSDKVGLIIKDIQRDKNKITEAANEFIENDDVRCIIGPVFSDDVRNTLTEIDRSNICLISPTATDDDLISISKNFYQANPTITSRGKIFAQYVYFVENKRRLAVLNSIEGYSPLLAASFTQEFEKLGGKIVAKETYKSKSYALTEQMTRISLIANDIDGIYAPISDANDASAILSQMVQSGLDLELYGNQDWFLGKGFESSSAISNKLTFDSDYFIDFYDPDYKNFSDAFKKTTSTETNRNVLYGYDTAVYILTVMRNIDPTRKNIKYKIESGINVTGFHNNISFDSDRNNKYLNIVRYTDGVFELVEKFRSGK